jgi:hypothetical protein
MGYSELVLKKGFLRTKATVKRFNIVAIRSLNLLS